MLVILKKSIMKCVCKFTLIYNYIYIYPMHFSTMLLVNNTKSLVIILQKCFRETDLLQKRILRSAKVLRD